MQFRGPAFEGDVTYFEGEVIAKNLLTPQGIPLITIKLRLANQDGGALVEATVDVEVPL
jgi:acyl dehydratase